MRHARPDYDRIQDPEGLIPEDEPVFLIRGQDELGAALVYWWADVAARSGVDSAMVRMAEQQAQRMERWHRHKTPDLPPDLKGTEQEWR